MNESTGNAVAYEVVNKVTGEVFAVNNLGSGDVNEDGTQDFIVHLPDGTEISFVNPDYQNDTYFVRQAVSKFSPDNKQAMYFSPEEQKQIEEGRANSAAFETTVDAASENLEVPSEEATA